MRERRDVGRSARIAIEGSSCDSPQAGIREMTSLDRVKVSLLASPHSHSSRECTARVSQPACATTLHTNGVWEVGDLEFGVWGQGFRGMSIEPSAWVGSMPSLSIAAALLRSLTASSRPAAADDDAARSSLASSSRILDLISLLLATDKMLLALFHPSSFWKMVRSSAGCPRAITATTAAAKSLMCHMSQRGQPSPWWPINLTDAGQ